MSAVPRRKASDSRTAESSSMTWTMGSSAMVGLRLDSPKCEVERGPAAGIGLSPDASAMRFDDRPRDRKADPHPLALGREERLEKLRLGALLEAGTGIGDGDLQHVVLDLPGGDGQLPVALADFRHRLDRVPHQVEEN